ncbi:MAG: phospholipid carrier-dependent glycosyltransferase, partial [Chloroflexi bacterium]|nr:phospholipid carrier-dependent glycosyltransferase [Chloroflexota bacterium]
MKGLSKVRKFSKQIQTLPLMGLVVLYLITGAMFILITPGFEKPDEDGHYGYILYLREQRALPPLSFADGFPSEYKQPPLYYLLAAGATSWLPLTDQPERLLEVNPYMYHSVPGQRNDNRNVFLHPPHLTPVVIGSRAVSLLFGLGAMLATGLIARQIAPDDARLSFVAAAIVGFHPKFLYLATAINNDVPVAFFGTVALLLLIRRLRRGPFRHFALLTGAMLGLASLTKVSGLVFFPLTALALLLIHRGWDRDLVREGLVILGVALLIGGGWYARNALVYHDPLSINRFFADLLSIEHTFWANPARSFVSRTKLGDLLVWWGRLSLGASLLWLLRRFRPWRFDADAATWVILLSWPVTFAALLLGYWTRTATWAYGRLLFPAMASFALLFAWGWAAVFPRR